MKYIQALMMTFVLMIGLSCSVCLPILADSLPGANGTIAIGDTDKATTVIHIRNKTGMRILSLRAINTETSEASTNFIRKGFEVDGRADMYYDFDEDATYTLQLTIKGKYYYLHHFPFDDASTVRIYKAKNYAYIRYTSLSTGETVSTKLKEKKYKGKDKYNLGSHKVDTSEDKTKIYTTEDSATESKPVVVSPETETNTSSSTYYGGGSSSSSSDNSNTYNYGGSSSQTTTDNSGSGYVTPSDSGSSTDTGNSDSQSGTPSITETPTDSSSANSTATDE